MWKSLDDSISLEVHRTTLMGKKAEQMGQMPEGKAAVLLASDGFVTEETASAMYLSALEASLAGRSVVTVAKHRGMASVIKGTEAGGGTLHIFTPSSFKEYFNKARDYVHAALSSGGSVTSLPDLETCWSAAFGCSSLFLTSVMGRSRVLEEAAGSGVETALLRPSLAFRGARQYAKDGCPVVDSYSSLFLFPEAIAYEKADGPYAFRDKYYDILIFQE